MGSRGLQPWVAGAWAPCYLFTTPRPGPRAPLVYPSCYLVTAPSAAHVTRLLPQALLTSGCLVITPSASCHLVTWLPGCLVAWLPGYLVTWLPPQALLEMQLASKPHMKDGTPYRGT